MFRSRVAFVALLVAVAFSLSACQSTRYSMKEITAYDMKNKSYDELRDRADMILDNYYLEKDLPSVAHAVLLLERAAKNVRRGRTAFKGEDANRWLSTQHRIGYAYYLLAKATNRMDHFRKSYVAHKKVLANLKPNTENWSRSHQRIAYSLANLGRYEKNWAYLDEAEKSANLALNYYADDEFELQRGSLKSTLGQAQIGRGVIKQDIKYFSNAVEILEEALHVYTPKLSIPGYSRLQELLGDAYRLRGELSKNTADPAKALEAYKEARRVLWEEEDKIEWQRITKSMAKVQSASSRLPN